MLKNLCASVHEMKTKRDIMQGHLSNAELMKLQNANGCSVTMHKCKQLFVSYIWNISCIVNLGLLMIVGGAVIKNACRFISMIYQIDTRLTFIIFCRASKL